MNVNVPNAFGSSKQDIPFYEILLFIYFSINLVLFTFYVYEYIASLVVTYLSLTFSIICLPLKLPKNHIERKRNKNRGCITAHIPFSGRMAEQQHLQKRFSCFALRPAAPAQRETTSSWQELYDVVVPVSIRLQFASSSSVTRFAGGLSSSPPHCQ